MEYLLPYLCMVTVPNMMVGLERMLDYRGVGLARFHCTISAQLKAHTEEYSLRISLYSLTTSYNESI